MKPAKGFGRQRRELTEAWLSYKWPALGAAFLILLLFVAIIGLSQHHARHNEQVASQVQAVIERVGRGFAGTYRQRFKRAEDRLGLEQLGRVMSAEGVEAVAPLLEAAVAAEASLLGARFVATGTTEVDRTTNPPLGYAALDMLRRVEKTGKTVRPEVLFFGSDNQQITALYSLRHEDILVGYLLVAYDVSLIASSLQAAVGGSAGDFYVEALQSLPKGRPLKLAVAGDRSLRQGPAASQRVIPGTAWRLALWQPPPSTSDGAIGAYVWTGYGVIALLVMGAVGYNSWRQRKREAEEIEYDGAATRALVADEADDDVLAHFDVPDALGSGPPPLPEVDDGASGIVFEEIEDSVFVDLPSEPPEPPKPAAPDSEPSLKAPSVEVPDTTVDLPPQSVFRAYDIRGVVGAQFGVEQFRDLGRAIGSEAYDRGQQTIVVARDGRLSSPELHEALISGLRATGRDVVDIGLVPTPVLYFSTHYLNTGSGVMVTASHNPPEYNGLKVMLAGDTLSGDEVSALRDRLESGALSVGEGNFQEMDLLSEYVRRVSEDIPVALGNAFRLVVDCGNGAAGPVAPKLFRALGHDVVELYCDVDGTFPNHYPDTSDPGNLEDLVAAVRENEADLGFAFDGDGDRLAVVDSTGNIILPDRLMMLYARDILSRNPGSKVVYDVKCSSRLGLIISKLGGTPIMWKTGHSFLRKKLKEEGAELAGDLSGHIFFGERWYGFDDAMYAAARLLEILMGIKMSPGEILAKLPTGLGTPELRVELEEGEHLRFMEAFFQIASFPEANVSTIDGVRADFPDGWGLVRASNTTPALTLRFEAHNAEALARIQAQFKALIGEVNPSIELPF